MRIYVPISLWSACWLSLCILMVSCSTAEEFQEYVPLTWTNAAGIIEASTLSNKEHLDRLERVLTYYRIPYKRISEEKLLISDEIDRDTVWNFTSKANNLEWLREHPP